MTGPDPANKGLLNAVLAVQTEAPTLPKDGHNPAFGGSKFTTLTKITETIGPILSKHGLVWMTFPGGTREAPVLKYSLLHPESGEGLHGDMPLLLSKADAQGMGSALTYCRRYSLCAVLNLVADDDDDGNAAGRQQSAAQANTQPTTEQLDELRRLFSMHQPHVDVLREMLKRVGLKDVTDEQLTGGKWPYMLTPTEADRLVSIFSEAA